MLMVKINRRALKDETDLIPPAMPHMGCRRNLAKFIRTGNLVSDLRVSTFRPKLVRRLRIQVCLLLIFISCLSPHSFADAMEHITVYRDDTFYLIIPWLLQLNNGDLVLTAHEAHARSKEQRGHVDPTARGILLRSRDGGRTWGEKVVVDEETYRFSQTEDGPVTQLSDGSLFLNLYSWAISPFPVGFPTDGGRPYAYTFEGEWTLRSTDLGRTWTPRQRLKVPGLPRLAARTPFLELPDHTLLLAVYGNPSPGQDYRNGSPEQPYHSWVIRSTDMGKTWGSPAVLAQIRTRKSASLNPVCCVQAVGN